MKKIFVIFFTSCLFFISSRAMETDPPSPDSRPLPKEADYSNLQNLAIQVVKDLATAPKKKLKDQNYFAQIINKSEFLAELKAGHKLIAEDEEPTIQKHRAKISAFVLALDKMVIYPPRNEKLLPVIAFCFQILLKENFWQFKDVSSLLEDLFANHNDKRVLSQESMMSFIDQIFGDDLQGQVLQLALRIKTIPGNIKGKQLKKRWEEEIEKSEFYRFIFNTEKEQVRDVLYSFIQSLNETVIVQPKNEGIINILSLCFKQLIKKKVWDPNYVFKFIEDLNFWHHTTYQTDNTPVLAFIDKVIAASYFTPDAEKFMNSMTYSAQFDPIAEIIKKYDGDISSEEAKEKIVKVGMEFFTTMSSTSYTIMSRGYYKLWAVSWHDAMKGMKHFRQTTVRANYLFLETFMQAHLSVAKSKGDTIDFKIIKKEIEYKGGHYLVSFAIKENAEERIIKSIVLSQANEEKVYLFVDELATESPQQKPNMSIELPRRSLYKLDPIINDYKIRLTPASGEEKIVILKAINDIGSPECALHTGIRHKGKLLLVEMMRQTGAMMGRALLSTIKTYIDDYKIPTGQEPGDFKQFQIKLHNVLVAIYFAVTNEALGQWHKEEFIKPILTAPTFTSDPAIEDLKNRMLKEFDSKWFIKTIMSCSYDKLI